ncbi:MAG TPA: bZIP transcription factor [Bryobacteraceae bacterium]|nr:bZIP transcription factor [Bryobacteraceae bacterium]
MLMRISGILLVCASVPVLALAQSGATSGNAEMQRVLDRLDRLEKQNAELLSEIRELRQELGTARPPAATSPPQAAAETPSSTPTPAERLDVLESRTQDLAQTRVETSQRMPVALTGMLLFNAFHNGGFGGNGQVPITAQLNQAPSSTGATFRQTVIGLKFYGPNLPGGGKASGSAYFDFWGGNSSPSNNLFRVRLATIDLAWKNYTITVGQDKPIVSPREPMSLAQVGLAPLTGAGNLWDWQPQIRVERRFGSDTMGLRAQGGIYETSEAAPPTAPAVILERQRPAYEARFLLYRGGETRRFEFAPGMHFSTTHVNGQAIDSRLFTMDWLVKPANFFEVSGAWFRGTNDAGLGAMRQGFTVLPSGRIVAVHATGGWSQLSLFPTNRLSFHFFGGEEEDRASDLVANSVRRNLSYAGNIVYKLAPNILAAFEASQTRTDYIASGLRLNNHYDLALAYLF